MMRAATRAEALLILRNDVFAVYIVRNHPLLVYQHSSAVLYKVPVGSFEEGDALLRTLIRRMGLNQNFFIARTERISAAVAFQYIDVFTYDISDSCITVSCHHSAGGTLEICFDEMEEHSVGTMLVRLQKECIVYHQRQVE